MSFQAIQAACQHQGLSIVGGFHPVAADNTPRGTQTLLLLGPDEPGFWDRLKRAPEFNTPDPVDRWSTRVISALASEFAATPLFPFGGPPYQPFISWAFRTGRVFQSPVSLMIHDTAGLFLSFRGALALREKLTLPQIASTSPCDVCTSKPCLAACPAGALTQDGYDVPACHDFLDQADGKSCLNGGCHVRRSCPVSQSYGRLAQQSAHHMRYFHKKADP